MQRNHWHVEIAWPGHHPRYFGQLLSRTEAPTTIYNRFVRWDSANLRKELDEHGTKPVIPNRCKHLLPN
jgi:hypothetical protein